MRVLWIIAAGGVFSALFLWLGWFKLLRRKIACLAAASCLLVSGGFLLAAVLPGNSFYGATVTSAPVSKKIIALTFDDGPYPPYTQNLLRLLREKQARATFFMVGDNAFAHQDAVRAVRDAGHEIALHAGQHRDLLKLDRQSITANIESGKMTLQWLTGSQVRYMRPPHGFRDYAVMEEIAKAGLIAVNWSVIPRDWTNPGAEIIAERVCANAFPGAIVLLHDGDSPAQTASRDQTVAAVGIIIDRLRNEGYEFVTVSELLQEGEYKEKK